MGQNGESSYFERQALPYCASTLSSFTLHNVCTLSPRQVTLRVKRVCLSLLGLHIQSILTTAQLVIAVPVLFTCYIYVLCVCPQVLMALGICTVVTLSLTLFACQTKYDFTLLHSGIFTLCVILFIVTISSVFFPYNKLVQLIIAGFGAFLFSLFLIYDTQLIVGGDHKYSFSPEEYVFATLTLYLDIINLFLRILRIIRLSH